MNIVSSLVGISIMGTAMPMVAQMSIQPFQAMKRAENFAVAETAAVVFAATYEGTLDIPENTETCITAAREGTENAYSVTCTHGTDQYVQSVTRAFRLAVPDQGLDDVNRNGGGRQFTYETPTRFGQEMCPVTDPWGVNGWNDKHYDRMGGACIAHPIWSQVAYQFSDPDAWLYDINNHNGWGEHADY